MHKHIKPFDQYITESFGDYTPEQLGVDFSNEFNVRAYSTTYTNSGEISIQQRGDIHPEEFSAMMQWVEDQGYSVDKEQSYPDFDYDAYDRETYQAQLDENGSEDGNEGDDRQRGDQDKRETRKDTPKEQKKRLRNLLIHV